MAAENSDATEVRKRVARYGYPYKFCVNESLPNFLQRYVKACQAQKSLGCMQDVPIALTVMGAKRFLIEVEDAGASSHDQAEQIQELLGNSDYVMSREAEGVLHRRLGELR